MEDVYTRIQSFNSDSGVVLALAKSYLTLL